MKTSRRLRVASHAILSFLGAAGVCASGAQGAEFVLVPAIALSEEYNNNVFLERDDMDHDFISRVQPSLGLKYAAARLGAELDYAYDFRYYSRQMRENEETHRLAFAGNIEPARNLFFIKISDDYSRVSLDNTRDLTSESLFVNQSERNVFSLNPYFVLRPSSVLTVNAGYTLADTWYKTEDGVDKRDHIAYADAVLEGTSSLSFSAGYMYTEDSNRLRGFTKNDAHAGVAYSYAEGSSIKLGLGNSWLDLEGGNGYSTVYWNAGVLHDFGLFQGSVDASREIYENPGSLPEWLDSYKVSLKRDFKRSALKLVTWVDEFRRLEGRGLRVRKYGADGGLTIEISPRLTGALNLSVEKFEQKDVDTYTLKYAAVPRLTYSPREDVSASVTVNHSDYYSPEITGVNYSVTRFIAEVRKSF